MHSLFPVPMLQLQISASNLTHVHQLSCLFHMQLKLHILTMNIESVDLNVAFL